MNLKRKMNNTLFRAKQKTFDRAEGRATAKLLSSSSGEESSV